MKRTLAALALVLAAGCTSGGGRDAAPTTTATIPVETTTTTTAATTTTTTAMALGVTQRYADQEGNTVRVTVYRYRNTGGLPDYLEREVAAEGERTVAAEVRVCVAALGPDTEGISLSWAPWSVGTDAGGSYEAWSTYSDDVRPLPLYPDGRDTPVGECRRGWVPFEVARGARPSFIEYAPGGGDPLRWPLRRSP